MTKHYVSFSARIPCRRRSSGQCLRCLSRSISSQFFKLRMPPSLEAKLCTEGFNIVFSAASKTPTELAPQIFVNQSVDSDPDGCILHEPPSHTSARWGYQHKTRGWLGDVVDVGFKMKYLESLFCVMNDRRKKRKGPQLAERL